MIWVMDNKLTALIFLFFLAFIVFIGFTVFGSRISVFTRAKEELITSSKSSLVYAWPLTASADGKTKIVVNVFVRNSNNLPLPNKSVSLQTTLGKVSESSVVTDKFGNSSFTLTSITPGMAIVSATVMDSAPVQITQQVSIEFK